MLIPSTSHVHQAIHLHPIEDGAFLPILSVKEEEEEYVADNGFNGLFEKDFTSDILFNIGMRRGVEMAEYLVRTITGDDGLKIKEVWTQYRIDNI